MNHMVWIGPLLLVVFALCLLLLGIGGCSDDCDEHYSYSVDGYETNCCVNHFDDGDADVSCT